MVIIIARSSGLGLPERIPDLIYREAALPHRHPLRPRGLVIRMGPFFGGDNQEDVTRLAVQRGL
jgi:hypothetical protein